MGVRWIAYHENWLTRVEDSFWAVKLGGKTECRKHFDRIMECRYTDEEMYPPDTVGIIVVNNDVMLPEEAALPSAQVEVPV